MSRRTRRAIKNSRRHARKRSAAVRRQRRFGHDDRPEYQLTTPLWLIEAMLAEPDQESA